MPNFLTNKKIMIPVVLIACMLLFIVIRLATRDVPSGSVVVDTNETSDVEVTMIGIHITGAVNNPGFYEIPRGSRVNDVIGYAGGAAEYAFLDGVNLAEIVFDQQQIHVPTEGETVPGNPGQRRVNLNTATSLELQTLPRVGEVTAQRIIETRQQMGGFRRVEDIINVRGITATWLEENGDLIVVP